mmetsp:Transcript_86450/g.201128  ORF Transcript_86450/g.201128 Transcript_86450/m.201128 type:complete len:216 (+) Transcript_86450:352-999(+)
MLWAVRLRNSKPAIGNVEDDVLVDHPRDSQNSLEEVVLHEGLAPNVWFTPLVEIPMRGPLYGHTPAKLHLQDWEAPRALRRTGEAPALSACAGQARGERGVLQSAAALMLLAIRVQRRGERTEDWPWEVCVGGATVHDRNSKSLGTRNDSAAGECHTCREDEVVVRGRHVYPSSAVVGARPAQRAMPPGSFFSLYMAGAVIAAHGETAPPGCKAN